MVFNGFWQFLTVLHKQVTVFAYCTLQAPGGHVQSLPHHALVLPWNVCASSRKFLGSPCCVHAQVGSKMGAYMGTYSYTHAYLQHCGTSIYYTAVCQSSLPYLYPHYPFWKHHGYSCTHSKPYPVLPAYCRTPCSDRWVLKTAQLHICVLTCGSGCRYHR